MITTIPLNQLVPSPHNVRKTGGASIDGLATSIAALGLLQNLTVSPCPDGKYAVEAGSRRLRALLHLASTGRIADDYAVPCQVIDTTAATETSLAENVMRQAMHPADEFDAFAALADAGSSVADIAARFGQTELFVRQRLKLANVAPTILADYRAGNATLEQMMALALTDDQAVQQRLWQAKDGYHRGAGNLRRALTAGELAGDTALAQFVGIDAYEAAGGQMRRDLFAAGEDNGYLINAPLATELAQAKLQRTADRLLAKEKWSWVEARVTFDYSDERAFSVVEPTYKGSKETWPDDVKACAGAIVTIGYAGKSRIKRGLVRPQDRKAAAAATGSEDRGGKRVNAPGELSFAAVQRLQAEATGIVQAELAAGLPRVALSLLAAELAARAFYDYSDYGTAQRQWIHVQRKQSGRMPGNLRDIIQQSAAGQRFADTETAWRLRLPKNKAGLRTWALDQDTSTLTHLLAFLAARELDVVDINDDQQQGVVALACAADVDLAEHWLPTEEWLATLPKAVVIAMVTDAAGATAAAPLAKLKKDQLPNAAVGLFPAGWLPQPLRPRPLAKRKKARSEVSEEVSDD